MNGNSVLSLTASTSNRYFDELENDLGQQTDTEDERQHVERTLYHTKKLLRV